MTDAEGGLKPPDGPGRSNGEPDDRFTYANERTYLAWNRTALALIATGVAATQLLPSFDFDYARRIIGVPLIVLGIVVVVGSYQNWRANQAAMRRGEPLSRSYLPEILGVGIVLVAVLATVLVIVSGET